MMDNPKIDNPFPGPKPYGFSKQHRYCHRTKLEQTITDRLDTARFSLIFGAAGSGKSSILHSEVKPKYKEKGHFVLIYNQWHQAGDLAGLQGSVDLAIKNELPAISEPGRKEILDLHTAPPNLSLPNNKAVVLIFDQIDHLYAPAVRRSDREKVLLWLNRIANDRGLPFRLHVVFGIREDFSGPLLAFLDQRSCRPDHFSQVPRLLLSEVWNTACGAVPRWSSDSHLKEQLRQTAFHKHTPEVDPDPEVDAALAQVVLHERFANEEKWRGSIVSYQTILRQYINGAVNQFSKDSKELSGKLIHKLSKIFVSGKQKKYCSSQQLQESIKDAGADEIELENAIIQLTDSNLITRVRGSSEAESVYALSHDSLCEVLESEAQLVDQEIRAAEEQKAADAKQLALVKVQAGVTQDVIKSLREEALLERTIVQRQAAQQLKAQSEEHSRQIALLLVTQKQEVDNLNRLHGEAVERLKTEVEATRQGLVLSRTQDLEAARQRYETEQQKLREQHRQAVAQVSGAAVAEVRSTTTEHEKTRADGQAKLAQAEAQRVAEVGAIRIELAQTEAHGQAQRMELTQALEQKHAMAQGLLQQLSRGRTWLAIALGALLGTSGWGGYSYFVQREQRRQVGGLTQSLAAEKTRCDEQQAACTSLNRSARRLAAAQLLFTSNCAAPTMVGGGRQLAPCGNPNQAASLLLEIPDSERKQLPQWNETAIRVVRQGRLRAVTVQVPNLDQLDYSQDGSLRAYRIRDTEPTQEFLLNEALKEPPKALGSEKGPEVKRMERSRLWQDLPVGKRDPSKIAGPMWLLSSPGDDAGRCANSALHQRWRALPSLVIPVAPNVDTRAVALTQQGIWLRDLSCPNPPNTPRADNDWLIADDRLGPHRYHYAAIDDKGEYLAAATGGRLRAIHLPRRHGAQPAKGAEVIEIPLQGELRDAQFRPGMAGRLAVASGNTISFWDLAMASQPEVNELHRFATDCMDAASRQSQLGETVDEARQAEVACVTTSPK